MALTSFLVLETMLTSIATGQIAAEFDIVLANGRVMDPETNTDAIRNVGIRNGKIAAISTRPLRGKTVIDATGLVVAPGFIDLHAHGMDAENNRYQARDGVTTALELEVGVSPVSAWYAAREGKSLINFGATVYPATMRRTGLQHLKRSDRWRTLFVKALTKAV
jgi:dihydroorotase